MRGVWIGTSGWASKEWAGQFYPKGRAKKDGFASYTRRFPTVEINATSYRLPTSKMVEGWRKRSPEGFVLAVAGSRYLTHLRRLQNSGPGLRKYFSRLKPLGDRAGPLLWQLPPNLPKTPEHFARLRRFLEKLPAPYRHAVEFRHPSWMDEQTFALLRAHHVCNVWISSLQMPADYSLTTDFAFLRFHGLKDGAYHDYTHAELAPWAKQLARVARQGRPAYVYFKNDLNTRAPLNAETLMKMLGKHAVRAFAASLAKKLRLAPPAKGPETWRPWTRAATQPRRGPPLSRDRAAKSSRASHRPAIASTG